MKIKQLECEVTFYSGQIVLTPALAIGWGSWFRIEVTLAWLFWVFETRWVKE